MELRYHAVILGKKDIAETDRLYFVYSQEEGKIILTAKGVRKQGAKLAGILEPLTLGEIFISKNRGRGNITGAVALENYAALKESLPALTRVFYSFSILQKMIAEKEKDERIYDLLLSYLFSMEETSRKMFLDEKERELKFDLLSQAFLWKMLDFLGYKIETGRCVLCQEKLKNEKNYFSARLGGIICAKCRQDGAGKISISPDAVKLLRLFWTNGLGNILKVEAPKKDIENLRLAAADFLSWIKF